MKFITEEELKKLWFDSSSIRDAKNELDSHFHNRVFEILDDDALLITTSITPDQLRELRKYFVMKANGGF
jgi:hypothetical protein